MDKRKKECSVCAKAGCSYKCPKCMSPYCSSVCCATHKESCPATMVKPADEVVADNVSAPTMDGEPIENKEVYPTDVKPKITEVVSRIKESDLIILQPAEKEGLVQCSELRTLLKSKRLRDDIALVDSSKDRQAALKALRARNPEFDSFVDVLLGAVAPQGAK